MNVIHHIEICCSNLNRSAEFYMPLMKALGFRNQASHVYVKDELLLILVKAKTKGAWQEPVHTGMAGLHHFAFSAPSREYVDKIYNRVIKKLPGVKIQDPPVDCPEYHYKEFYATFFYDPDGTKLEVVYASPENSKRYRLKKAEPMK